MANNRELSQFGSFIYVNDTSGNIGIASTASPYVGIGTTNPTSKLTISGDVLISGVITASNFSGSFNYAANSGVATYSFNAGIATIAGYASTAGIATYAVLAGIATYAKTAGVATYASTAGVATYANTAGVATYANHSGVSTIAGYATTSGIATVSQGLTGTPNITVGTITAVDASFSGNVSIAGTLTYDDVTNVDSLGIVTARSGILVGPPTSIGATISSNGNASFAGVVTATSFIGSGSNLTGLTGASANTYGSDAVIPVITVDANGRITSIGTSGVNFNTATVSQSEKVKTITNSNNSTHFLTFVDSNNVSGDYESLYTDSEIVYNPSTNNLGIGTTNATSRLTVSGDALFTGIVTAASFSGNATSATYASTSGISTLAGYASTAGVSTYANTAGVATYASIAGVATVATYANTAGVATYANIAGVSTYANTAGVSTYASTAGVATYANTAGVSTYANTAGVSTYANTAGVSTYANTAGVATYANTAGISTYASTSGLSTNLKGGNAGDIPYQSATDATTFVNSSGAALGQVLLWGGSSPIWGNVSAASGSFGGITVKDENNVVGTANSITTINFVGSNVTVNATSGANGIATVTISDYITTAGVATYATIAGIATYASTAGVATYTNTAGVATYSNIAGVATYANTAGVATYADAAGIATYSNIAGVATYAPTAGVATALQNSRNFSITGDFVTASAISFNGTGNVALAATIAPDSIELGTYTSGDYVKNISGTTNQITVTGGTGEGSTPVISIPSNPVLPGNVTIANNLQVNNNLNVSGNITIGGTSAYIITNDFRVQDADIVLGFTTNSSNQEVSNDTTANHGGIAVASTEGSPLVQLFIAGIETTPATYKKIMWFKAGSFAGLGTDAWLSNYAVGIGSTQFPSGTRLAAGNVQFTENDLAVVRNINASGVITASSFIGNATSATYASIAGIATYASTAGVATYANTAGVSTYASTAGVATYANTAGVSTYASLAGVATYANTAGVATYASLSGVSTYANTAGVATYASLSGVSTYASLAGVATYANTAGVATYASTSGVSTNVIGGIASVTQLSVSGVSTFSGITTHTTSLFGTQASFTGIVTATSFSGSGSALTGIVTSIVAGTNVTISGSTGQVTINAPGASGISTQWGTTSVGINTLSNVGIGTTNPTSKLTVSGDASFSGIVTATSFSGSGATINNIRIGVADNNTIDTSTGGLTLDSSSGTVTVNDNLAISGNNSLSFNSSAFNISHISGNANILNGLGDLIFGADGNKSIRLERVGVATLARFTHNGSSELYHNGSKTFETVGSGATITGTLFTNRLNVSGVSTLGVTTTDTINFNGRVSSSIVPSQDNTFALGSASNRWSNIFANTFNGTFVGTANSASALSTSRNIAITGDLSWNVNFDGSSNATSTGTLANSGVTAGTYGSTTQVGIITVDAKGRVTAASNVGINFSTATVAQADTVKTLTSSTNATFFPTFVDSDNSVAAYESLFTDVGITFNPSTNRLNVSGIVSASQFVGDGSGLTNVGAALTVSTRNGFAGINSTDAVSNVKAIRFDSNSGFAVTSLGNGEVFVNFGSSFNPWTVTGQTTLDATGEEPLQIIAGAGIEITTNATSTPKSITFTATAGTGGGSGSVGVGSTATGSFNVGIGSTVFDTLSKTSGSVEYRMMFLNNSNTQVERLVVINDRTNLYLQENDMFYNNNMVVSLDAVDTGTEYKLYLVAEAGLSGVITYRHTKNTIIAY